MTHHPVEIALAISLAGISLLVAWLLSGGSSIELPPALDTPKPSLKMSRKELLQLAREHKIGTAKWRSFAKKSDFVQALQQELG